MTKPQVLFIGDLNTSLPEFNQFQSKFDCIFYQLTTVEQLIIDLKTRFLKIEAIYGAWLGFVPFGGFKDQILELAPSTLKIISICSVGYDGYDGEGMAKKNIVLTNVPSVGAAEPVAELVLYNTLLSFRQFNVFSSVLSVKNNHTVKVRKMLDQTSEFDYSTGLPRLNDGNGYAFGEMLNERKVLSPRGHNAVIVGFGNIGQTIGKELSDIGMNIHYVKRNPLSESQQAALGYDAKYYSSILQTKLFVDLIVIAAPATSETNHLINEDVINEIEKPFRIINIGRGTIIDEQALVDGLNRGKVLFAGLDVFEKEPQVHPGLFGRQDVVLTPHVGASTIENFDFTAIQAMKNIESVLTGGKPLNQVN